MTRKVLVVRATAPLDEVAAALVREDVGAAPVRGGGGRIVGVIARADLMDLERIAAVRSSSDDPSVPLSAGALMTAAFVVAHPGDPAIDAARLLVTEPAHRLLVFDESDQLVGIVTPADLLRTLLHPSAAAAPAPTSPPPPARPPGPEEPPPRTVH